MKLTPPALVAGVGLSTYEVTTAVMEVGAADAAIAIAQNLKDLPSELRARLHSDDPTVRGEALVDTLAMAGASTAIVGRLQQSSGQAITVALEKQAALQAEAAAIAKTKVENNLYRDSSLADPGKTVYSATGPWKPAAQLSANEANDMLAKAASQSGMRRVDVMSADNMNKEIISEKPDLSPPYMPGTNAIVVKTTSPTHFVRYYVDVPGNSKQAGHWMMRSEDIAGLTAEQIASKYALPQVPTHVTEVLIPPGHELRATVANDINIFPTKSIGGNGGGGGVQFELLTKPKKESDFEKLFFNSRTLK